MLPTNSLFSYFPLDGWRHGKEGSNDLASPEGKVALLIYLILGKEWLNLRGKSFCRWVDASTYHLLEGMPVTS
jgi:hypothetical protein